MLLAAAAVVQSRAAGMSVGTNTLMHSAYLGHRAPT